LVLRLRGGGIGCIKIEPSLAALARYKLFAAATLAASTYAQQADCCELYTEPNFEGRMEEACLKKNWYDEYLDTVAYSFINIGGADLEMNDALGSFKCGPLVKADFCFGEPLKYRNLDNL
jgi:hypothetical protein